MELFKEIFQSVSKNLLRSILTSFSVFLGIFIFVVLLGAGRGLENGVSKMFEDDASNSIWVYPSITSMPYKGLKEGRRIEFNNDDQDFIEQKIDGIEYSATRYSVWGAEITHKNQMARYPVRSTQPDHQIVEGTIITSGRFLTERDVKNIDKVIVIGKTIVDELFKGNPALGSYVDVFGIPFKVVGTFEDNGNSRWENRVAYIPITTGQRIFAGSEKIDRLILGTGTASLDETKDMSDAIFSNLSKKHIINPEDKRALYVANNNEEMDMVNTVMLVIQLFVGFIGIMTLISGIIGVANIMTVVVKERTQEIGIRKAIGATPRSITWMITLESIILTTIAGFLGLALGVFLLKGLGMLLDSSGGEAEVPFTNPNISPAIGIGVVAVLVFLGAIAGLIPALRASLIKPIEALKAS